GADGIGVDHRGRRGVDVDLVSRGRAGAAGRVLGDPVVAGGVEGADERLRDPGRVSGDAHRVAGHQVPAAAELEQLDLAAHLDHGVDVTLIGAAVAEADGVVLVVVDRGEAGVGTGRSV